MPGAGVLQAEFFRILPDFLFFPRNRAVPADARGHAPPLPSLDVRQPRPCSRINLFCCLNKGIICFRIAQQIFKRLNTRRHRFVFSRFFLHTQGFDYEILALLLLGFLVDDSVMLHSRGACV
jgi:hypothetical protein